MNDFDKESMLKFTAVGYHATPEQWLEQAYLSEDRPWLEICGDTIDYLKYARRGARITLDSEYPIVEKEIENGFALGFAILKEHYSNWTKYPIEEKVLDIAIPVFENELISIIEVGDKSDDLEFNFETIYKHGVSSSESEFVDYLEEIVDDFSPNYEFKYDFLFGAYACGRLFKIARSADIG